MLQNESNRLAKIRQALFTRFPLAVGSGHFGAIRDVPGTVLLNNRRELIVHASILPPAADATEVRHFDPYHVNASGFLDDPTSDNGK